MWPLNKERGFVVHIFRQESEGNDPRCRLVVTYVNERRDEEEASYQRGSWVTLFMGKELWEKY